MRKKSANYFQLKTISPNAYVLPLDVKPSKRSYSIFSTLDFLNKHTDLAKSTKNTIETSLKTLYSADKLVDLLVEQKCNSIAELCKKIQNVYSGKEKNTVLVSITKDIDKLKKFVKNAPLDSESVEKDNEDEEVFSYTLNHYENNAFTLVKYNTINQGRTNRYIRLESNEFNNKLMPISFDYKQKDEGLLALNEIQKYIKNTYNYKFKISAEANPLKFINRTLNIYSYSTKMSDSVNMFYNVAKNLVGTKKITLSKAKKIIQKDEINDFLNSKTLNQKQRKEVFTEIKPYIEDVVATLTTIFMARFYFDAKYFSAIEEDLTEQAMVKMKHLRVANNIEEDYWINELIQDRLKLNISQVLSANNITNANQLLEIYDKNGTKILKPNLITNLEDLVFSVQYSGNERVKNKPLNNLIEQNIEYDKKKFIKNKVKVKKPKRSYLDEIRKTEEYKLSYQEWKDKLVNYKESLAKSSSPEEIDKIIETANNNLTDLESINPSTLNDKQKNDLTETVAKNDAAIDMCEGILQEKQEVINSVNNNSKPKEDIIEENPINSNPDNSLNFANNQNESENNKEPQNTSFEETENASNVDEKNTVEKNESELTENNIDEPIEENNTQENSDLDSIKDDISVSEKEKNENNITKDSESITEILEDQNKDLENQDDNIEGQTNDTNTVVYKTSPRFTNQSYDNQRLKIEKYFRNLIYGKNGKIGLIGGKLNYRIIQKNNKEFLKSDSQRLNDRDFNKANKIRDVHIDELISLWSMAIVEDFHSNKEIYDENVTAQKVILSFFKDNLNIDKEKPFTKRNLEKVVSVLISNEANADLKEMNVELYTGKETFKKYKNISNVEENNEK